METIELNGNTYQYGKIKMKHMDKFQDLDQNATALTTIAQMIFIFNDCDYKTLYDDIGESDLDVGMEVLTKIQDLNPKLFKE